VQKLALPPFTLIGQSMGGAVAFTYAATYPEDVKRPVIEDSAPLPLPSGVMLIRVRRRLLAAADALVNYSVTPAWTIPSARAIGRGVRHLRGTIAT